MTLDASPRPIRAVALPIRASSLALGALLGGSLLLGGCATHDPQDPLQPYNRAMFSINRNIDKVVLKPVAIGYRNVTPEPVRRGVSNFFGNLDDVWSTGNDFLQGHVAQGFNGIMRVGVNTVFGVFGLVDIATPLGLYKQPNDFGLTLARWGLGAGPYIVLPILGPSTLRDTAGTAVDISYAPVLSTTHNVGERNAAETLRLVSRRAALLSTTDLLDQIAIDPYLFTRDAYLQRRRAQVSATRHTGVLATVPSDDTGEGGAGAGTINNGDTGGADNGLTPQPAPTAGGARP